MLPHGSMAREPKQQQQQQQHLASTATTSHAPPPPSSFQLQRDREANTKRLHALLPQTCHRDASAAGACAHPQNLHYTPHYVPHAAAYASVAAALHVPRGVRLLLQPHQVGRDVCDASERVM